MGTEIERKFLVAGNEWRPGASGVAIQQAYLVAEPGCTVRIRRQGSEAFLTLKGRSKGVSWPEFEYPIPPADAEAIIHSLGPLPAIDKTRYSLTHTGTRTIQCSRNVGRIMKYLDPKKHEEPQIRYSFYM